MTLILLLPIWLLSTRAEARGGAYRPHRRAAVAQIRRLEVEWRNAQLREDVTTMDQLLSDDFLGITAAGTVVTKGQELERIRRHRFVLSDLQVTDVQVKLIGSIAIVTSLARVEGVSAGEPLSGDYRYTRVYQRSDRDTWKITSFEATRIARSSAITVALR